MDPFLQFRFEAISFFLGFLTASFVLWLIARGRRWIPKLISRVETRFKILNNRKSSGLDQYLRSDVQKRAQHGHLAQALFSLDEILINPRLLVPDVDLIEIETITDEQQHTRTLASLFIPYHPDFPELASQFPYPSISLDQAILRKANLVIIGKSGSGKSVALAHLASQLSRNRGASEVENRFPLYLHVHDLTLPLTEEPDPLTSIVSVIIHRSPKLLQKQIPGFIRLKEVAGNLVIILDGLDEIHSKALPSYVKFLGTLIRCHPAVQIVTSASNINIDGLVRAGFTPLALASWSHKERETFIENWGNQWSKLIRSKGLKIDNPLDVNPSVIKNWLSIDDLSLSPLEWTMRLWALYSGDLRGNLTVNALQAYMERHLENYIPSQAINSLARELIIKDSTAISPEDLNLFISQAIWSNNSASSQNNQNIHNLGGSETSSNISYPFNKKTIETLIEAGFLRRFASGTISFSHPLFIGYLASLITSDLTQIPNLDPSHDTQWDIDFSLRQFLAVQGHEVELIEKMLFSPDPPLYFDLLKLSRWTKDFPSGSPIVGQILRQLIQYIHRDDLIFGLRSRFLIALLQSNDPSIKNILRQLLSSQSPVVRCLASLGCGALRDDKAIDGLSALLQDPDPFVRITSAFSIGIQNSPSSNSVCHEMLTSGDEEISQVAAECLAQTEIGQEILKEAALSEQILTRRAAVIGLALTRQNWAFELLQRIAIQDGQWVVRNAAGQMLESIKNLGQYSPALPLQPYKTPWLISYAAKQGEILPVGEPSYNLIFKALESATLNEKIASLKFLYCENDEKIITELIHASKSDEHELGQAALNALYLTSLSGIQIPA